MYQLFLMHIHIHEDSTHRIFCMFSMNHQRIKLTNTGIVYDNMARLSFEIFEELIISFVRISVEYITKNTYTMSNVHLYCLLLHFVMRSLNIIKCAEHKQQARHVSYRFVRAQ